MEKNISSNNQTAQNFSNKSFSMKTLPVYIALFVMGMLVGVYGYKSYSDKNPKNISTTIQNTSQISPTPTVIDKTKYELLSETCDNTECLFATKANDFYPEGYGLLNGYYHQYQGVDWGNVKVTCDSLLVTGGSEKLTLHFKDLIERHNGINALDEKGNLLVNISLKNLNNIDRQKVLNSSSSNPVTLGVIRFTPDATEANKCFSFVDIVSVK